MRQRRASANILLVPPLSRSTPVGSSASLVHLTRHDDTPNRQSRSPAGTGTLWLAWGTIYPGWSLTMLGQPEEGLTWLRKGLSACRTPENTASVPFALILLTTAYLKLGRTDEALHCLAEAAQIIETSDERYFEAELQRLRGEVLNAIGDGAAAEQNYHQALATAKRQSAKTLELRAVTSLARLWRNQHKREKALELLAPVYG